MTMPNLNIDIGVVRLKINENEENYIEFNPKDVIFAEKFYRLIGDLEAKIKEYEERAKELEKVKAKDDHGLPANAADQIAFQKEAFAFIGSKVDDLFGAGTTKKLFGDAVVLQGFEQFFKQVTPYIQSTRKNKIETYTNRRRKRE